LVTTRESCPESLRTPPRPLPPSNFSDNIRSGSDFKDFFNQPTSAELGTMVAILEVGAFISSLVVGRIGDVLGRRRTILYGSIIFVIGGALQTFANGMAMMLLGRIIAGLGVGTLSTIVPVYQSEISPPHNRGKMGCIEFTGNIAGYAASVWVDYFCSFMKGHKAWRVPLFMQCVMGLLLAAGSLLICESPRFVMKTLLLERMLTHIDGFWIMTMTRKELWSLQTCSERATFTTPKHEKNIEKSR
jgi:MFS family permease